MWYRHFGRSKLVNPPSPSSAYSIIILAPSTAAATTPPAPGPIKLAAAPELVAAAPPETVAEGLCAAVESAFWIPIPPTPVVFVHSLSARSAAVALKVMSAHCATH
jgi:hypothetical protein